MFIGKILFVTISKTPSNKYFISFNVECEHEILPKNNNGIETITASIPAGNIPLNISLNILNI